VRLFNCPLRVTAIAVTGLIVTGVSGVLANPAVASQRITAPRYVTLTGSYTRIRAERTGSYASPSMSVEVALAPRGTSRLNALLSALYTPGSGEYHRWLAKGQFDAQFAPGQSVRAAVGRYLARSGLTVMRSASPFLVRAEGSSRQVSAALGTPLTSYLNSRGQRFFANSAAVRLPRWLAGRVLGVIGLTNLVREHDLAAAVRPTPGRTAPGRTAPGRTAPRGRAVTGCETGYPTDAQLAGLYIDGDSFTSGYGAGPGCSGLTPAQTNSLYNAPDKGPAGKGAGQTLAVFELSAYRGSDIDIWAHSVYGPGFRPPVENVSVDGGPLHPACPAGDICPPSSEGYAGDIEVDADIETQLTIAPDATHIVVYNAPNDETGQTSLDEYTVIAAADLAVSVSSSWGECENDVGAAMAKAENVVFEQMATQGQSMFAAAGDDGAFDCLGTDGTSMVNVDDPATQPWVTSAGGTSFESLNPGTNPAPAYPANNVETVWNPRGLCDSDANENGADGLFWCASTGAGGGGSSQFWGRPSYQHGQGVNNQHTTYANGSTHCSLAKTGTPCREVPDISANADEWTPYAEYCTGNASTPNSICGEFSSSEPVPGWFGIGGTSLSSPLWSGIAADLDSYTGVRSGNLNPLLYSLFNKDPGRYFHDITGIGANQAMAKNNGLFPTTPGYDEATGIGTPNLAALITGS
jgi:subtilase family serine protease